MFTYFFSLVIIIFEAICCNLFYDVFCKENSRLRKSQKVLLIVMPAKGCLLIVRLIILESRCQSFQKQRMVGRKLIRRGQLSNQLCNLSNITDNRISNFKRRFFILHGVSRIKTLLLILYHSIAHFINQKVAEITKRSPFMATFKH